MTDRERLLEIALLALMEQMGYDRLTVWPEAYIMYEGEELTVNTGQEEGALILQKGVQIH